MAQLVRGGQHAAGLRRQGGRRGHGPRFRARTEGAQGAERPRRIILHHRRRRHTADCRTPLSGERPGVVSFPRIHREKAVENGLPRESLQHVAEAISGGDKAKASAFERGIVPKTTLERRESKLSRPESERTERVARIFVHARRALGTEDEAREFMTTPHPELDGRSPLDAVKTDLGARRAEQILNALEFGLAV